MSKHLNIVIHGVGEHRPGETLDLLIAGAFGTSDASLESTMRQLPEITEDDQEIVPTFPCEIRKVTIPDQELVFAEVYWADLSRTKEGIVATFIGLMTLLINLSHLIRESVVQEKGSGSWTGRLVSSFLVVMYGPILALNVVLFVGIPILALAFAAAGSEQGPAPGDPPYVHLAFVGLGLASIGWGWYLRGRANISWLGLLFGWSVVACGLGILIFILASALFDSPAQTMQAQAEQMIRRLVHTMQTFYFVACAILLLYAAPWFPGLVRKTTPGPPFYVAASSGMALMLFFVSGIFWASVYSTLDGIVWAPVAKVGEVLHTVLSKGIEGIPIVWGLIGLVVVPALVAVIRRRAEVNRDVNENRAFSEPRRLIIARGLARMLTALAVVFAVLATFRLLVIYELLDDAGGLPKWLKDLFPISLALAGLTGVLYATIWQKVAIGVAMGNDVVTYFVKHQGQRPTRERIHSRVQRVLETMVASETPDTLTVLAHSQGTVIAIDYIRDNPNWQSLIAAKGITTQLVTMGSPYRHLYQYYFKGGFLGDWRPGERLDRWLNIFRRDDYIGTTIRVDENWPDNRPIGARGHTAYWTDREVHRILGPDIWAFESAPKSQR